MRGCQRHDLPEIEPRPSLLMFASSYHGRAPLRLSVIEAEYPGHKLAPQAADNPPEPPGDGCPGAWYRSPFVSSLGRYMRHADSNGGRVPNLLLDDAPSLVRDAITYYEQECARHSAHCHEVERQRREANDKAADAKRKGRR